MTDGHDAGVASRNTRLITARCSWFADPAEATAMITPDPTILWMLLIGFGMVALRITQRTHRVR
jgi:hypothetical protein